MRLAEICKGFNHLIRDKNAWPQELVEFSKDKYKQYPWALSSLPMAVAERGYKCALLEIPGSKLESYAPCASMIWGLRIQDVSDEALKLLTQFTSLTTLNHVHGSKVTDEGLKHLPDTLTTLELWGCPNITDEGLKTIGACCPKLAYLDLRQCQNISGTSFEYLPKNLETLYLGECNLNNESLQHLPKTLTTLYIVQCSNITEAVIDHLPNTINKLYLSQYNTAQSNHHNSLLPSTPNLNTTLCLTRYVVSKEGLQYVTEECKQCSILTGEDLWQFSDRLASPLQSYSDLRTLCLKSCTIDDDAFEHLPSTLTTLNLIYTDITDKALEAIGAHCPNINTLKLQLCPDISGDKLQHLPDTLAELDLNHNNIIGEDLHTIGTRCPNLTTLKLQWSTKIDDDALHYLPDTLTKLDLSCCMNITDRALQAIGARCPNISVLKLQMCSNVSGNGFQYLPDTLTELNLSGCTDTTDKALESIGIRCPNLSILKLQNCTNISVNGLKHLPKTLTELDLRNGRFGDDALQYLPDTLTELDLSCCMNITNEGLKTIGACCPNLHTLKLVLCPEISDEGLMHLPSSLKVLDLGACRNIGSTTESYLKEKCPGLEIIKDRQTSQNNCILF